MHQIVDGAAFAQELDRKSTRLNSSHSQTSYAVFCLKKKKVRFQPGLPVVKVTYTLFEEDRALDDIKVEAPPTVEATGPPFDAAIPVPAEAVGAMRLLAGAQVAERRGQYVLFDEGSLGVGAAAELKDLVADIPVRFTKTVGADGLVGGRGRYAG